MAVATDADADAEDEDEDEDDGGGFARECSRLRGSFGGRNFRGVW